MAQALAYFLGYLLAISLGVLFLYVGLQAFTAKGLPVSKRKMLKGTAAHIIGGIISSVGLIWLFLLLWNFVMITLYTPANRNAAQQAPPEPPLGSEYGPIASGPGWGQSLSGPVSLALFDGKSTFGWSGGKVKGNKLIGGTTTGSFAKYALSIDVADPGTLVRGKVSGPLKSYVSHDERELPNDRFDKDKGKWQKKDPNSWLKSRGPITLEGTAAITRLVLVPEGLQSYLWHVPYLNPQGPSWKAIDLEDGGKAGKKANWIKLEHTLFANTGPGIYELTSQLFGDFILHVVLRSALRHSKGGILIRCEPGQPLSGYHITVFNAAEKNDPNKPSPGSTGSIKGHRESRQLVSRDGFRTEITIIAVGAHFATWVNGFQQTDWTDTRPKSEDARKGLRLTPGTIQLWIDGGGELEFEDVRALEW
jgi:hypothetical protein